MGEEGVVFTETLESCALCALVSAGPRWEGSPRAHALLGLLGGSLQASWGKERAELIRQLWDRALCATWALGEAESQGFAPPLQEVVESEEVKGDLSL